MNRYLPLILGLVLSSVSGAQAQILFSAPVAITQDPSQIDTLGTYVDAVGANGFSSTPITVGTTTFNYILSDPGIVLSSPTGINGGSDGSGSSATPFKSVLDGVAYVGDFNAADVETGTVTLNNLKVGDAYQVQIFSLGGFNTEVQGLNTQDIHSQHTIGSFVATGVGITTSQTFTFDSSLSGIGEINAISLRDVTELPEPSTYALMAGGLAALGFFIRRGLIV